jgi:hypothetical protein
MSVGVRAVLAVAAAILLVGCSGGPDSLPPRSGLEDDTRPSGGPESDAGRGDGGSVECISFETRECTIDLGVSNGVHNCAKGTQVCEQGVWSDCAPIPSLR